MPNLEYSPLTKFLDKGVRIAFGPRFPKPTADRRLSETKLNEYTREQLMRFFGYMVGVVVGTGVAVQNERAAEFLVVPIFLSLPLAILSNIQATRAFIANEKLKS